MRHTVNHGWQLSCLGWVLAMVLLLSPLSAFPSMRSSQTLEEYLARYEAGTSKPRCIHADVSQMTLRLKTGSYLPSGDLELIVKKLLAVGDAVGAASGYDHRSTVNFFVKHPATNSYLAFVTVENLDPRVSELPAPAIAVLVIDLRDWRISSVE